MRSISRSIEIDASPERVWSVLTDRASFPEWNPFIRRLEGELTVGERLEVEIEPPGGRAMTFKPTVTAVTPNRELRWLGHLLVRGLFGATCAPGADKPLPRGPLGFANPCAR